MTWGNDPETRPDLGKCLSVVDVAYRDLPPVCYIRATWRPGVAKGRDIGREHRRVWLPEH